MNTLLQRLFNKKTVRKSVFLLIVVSVFFLFSALDVSAQPQEFFEGDTGSVLQNEDPTYRPLAPFPGIDGGEEVTVSEYFSAIYKIGVSLALVIAVVMLIYGGIQYMTSDSIGGKSGGRETIGKAIIGIVLAVTSYALLYVIGGVGAVTVGFNLPEGISDVAPPPSEHETSGTPLLCYNTRARGASFDEKTYFCGPDVEDSQRILFKLPYPGQSNESYDEPGACYQVQESDVLDIANEECMDAGGEIEELDSFFGSQDYLYGYYCLADATEEDCTNILEGEFSTLEGMSDTMWDEFFCDTRNVPTDGTTSEQREEFDELSRQFFDELLVGNSYQTSGYYFDEKYRDVAGSGTHYHTGIDIGTGRQPLTVTSPVSGTFYVLREPGYNGYDDNGKFAIVENEFSGNPNRIWVFTHVDNFQLQHGQPVERGDSLAKVGEEPCFPLVGGDFQCDMGAHLDLNIYTDPSMLFPQNDSNNWTEANMTSGRHEEPSEIAPKTACPFQAYWEYRNNI